jgi:hypothetical protein
MKNGKIAVVKKSFVIIIAILLVAGLFFFLYLSRGGSSISSFIFTPRKGLVSIEGRIEKSNEKNNSYVFDLEGLRKLGETTYSVKTPVDEVGDAGKVEYRGVPLVRIVSFAGFKKEARKIYIYGGDGYTADLSFEELPRLKPLVAYERDGVSMSSYKKGPLMLVFPMDELSSQNRKTAERMWVWNLKKIRID